MGKNSKNRQRSSNSKKSVRRRRVAKRTSRTVKSTPIDYIVKGARTLIGLLPGQAVLKPIADFIFGSTKITTVSYFDCMHKPGILDTSSVSTIGLQVGMELRPTVMITDAPSIVTSKNGDLWYSNYTKCCLKTLKVTVVSTCPSARKCGMWGVCLMPIPERETDVPKSMTYRQLTETPHSRYGPVTQSLSLSYVPTPRHPRCYGMINITDSCIKLFVAFEDPQDGSDYTSEDFGCNIQISGSVTLCCRNGNLNGYDRAVPYTDETIYYTVDGYTVFHSELGKGEDDLNRMMLDMPRTQNS